MVLCDCLPIGASEQTNPLPPGTPPLRVTGHVVEFLCAATGGPCLYTGRGLKTTHTGLGIAEDDWNKIMKHLEASLDKFKFADRARSEMIPLISGLKGDVVGR